MYGHTLNLNTGTLDSTATGTEHSYKYISFPDNSATYNIKTLGTLGTSGTFSCSLTSYPGWETFTANNIVFQNLWVYAYGKATSSYSVSAESWVRINYNQSTGALSITNAKCSGTKNDSNDGGWVANCNGYIAGTVCLVYKSTSPSILYSQHKHITITRIDSSNLNLRTFNTDGSVTDTTVNKSPSTYTFDFGTLTFASNKWKITFSVSTYLKNLSNTDAATSYASGASTSTWANSSNVHYDLAASNIWSV